MKGIRTPSRESKSNLGSGYPLRDEALIPTRWRVEGLVKSENVGLRSGAAAGLVYKGGCTVGKREALKQCESIRGHVGLLGHAVALWASGAVEQFAVSC